MKTKMGEPTWRIWRQARDPEFVAWFEQEFFGGPLEKTEDSKNLEWETLNMKKV